MDPDTEGIDRDPLNEVREIDWSYIYEPWIRQSACYQSRVGPGGEALRCHSCPFTSGTVDEVSCHQYRCNHCGEGTRSKGEMFTHLRTVHYGNPCPVPDSCCTSILFTSRTTLIHHIMLHHHLPVMECHTCGKVMVQSQENYDQHSAACRPSTHPDT